MLLGRERELAAIDELLGDVREERGRVLAVVGEAGIGKTALLEAAVARVGSVRVLRTLGVESETIVPNAGLDALVRPLRSSSSRLVAAARDEIERSMGPGTGAADRFGVAAALLELLGNASAETPLLLVVDDLQWIDAASRDALGFVARRLANDPIGLLVGTRPDDIEPFVDVPTLHLEGLDDSSALALLEQSGLPIDPGVARAIVRAAHGSPLVLEQAPRLLTSAQRAGSAPLPDPLPIGPALTNAFLQRAEELPAATRAALALVAAADRVSPTALAGALTELGGVSVLDPAEAVGLVSFGDDEVTFTHPLMRSAVYHALTADRRRDVHRRLAASHAAAGDELRSALHRALASGAPDEAVAADLKHAALATGTMSSSTTGRMLVLAARLTPDPAARATRLLEGARALTAGGAVDEASVIVDGVLASGVTAATPDAELLRAELVAHRETTTPNIAHMAAVADGLIDRSPPHAGALLSIATYLSLQSGDPRAAREIGSRAFALTGGAGGIPELAAATGLSQALMLLGRYSEADPVLERVRQLVDDDPPIVTGSTPLAVAAFNLMIAEMHDAARGILDRVIAHGRTHSAPSTLPFPLATSAELRLRTGDWAAADAESDDAARMAAETKLDNVAGYVAAVRARIAGLRGRHDVARDQARVANERADRLGTRSLFMYSSAALGQAALGAGAVDDAIAHLEATAAHADEFGVEEPNVIQWQADLIEAYLRAGRRGDAATALCDAERRPGSSRRRWARATLARCRAALEEDGEAFDRAIELARDLGNPYELARTQLLRGEVLRRSGRKADATSALRAAAAAFERLGARDWLARTSSELAAVGEHRPERRDPIGDLTPQELRVALAIGAGATNREAAAALFLTVKTIEFHLSNVYAKLNLRSRTELALWMAERGKVVAAPG